MAKFEELIGKTLTDLKIGEYGEWIRFYCDDGSIYVMQHHQDCCEQVSLEDIEGGWYLDELIGSPILDAREEVKSGVKSGGNNDYGSETWTFYILATVHGSTTFRWYGSSNGYYSESVDFSLEKIQQ